MTKTKTNTNTRKMTTKKSSTRKMSKSSSTTTTNKTIGSKIHPKLKRTTPSTKNTTTKVAHNALFTIEHKFEESTFIKSFRWVATNKSNPVMGNMTVVFKNGDRYLYEGFTKEMAMSWRRRKSAGSFFTTYVKAMNSKRV